MSDESESVLIKLTRMEGKLDLSNLRHDQTDAWKVTVDQRLQGHGNRISHLETRDNILVGERQGIGIAAKVMPFLFGGGVMGIAAIIARALGA